MGKIGGIVYHFRVADLTGFCYGPKICWIYCISGWCIPAWTIQNKFRFGKLSLSPIWFGDLKLIAIEFTDTILEVSGKLPRTQICHKWDPILWLNLIHFLEDKSMSAIGKFSIISHTNDRCWRCYILTDDDSFSRLSRWALVRMCTRIVITNIEFSYELRFPYVFTLLFIYLSLILIFVFTSLTIVAHRYRPRWDSHYKHQQLLNI